MKPSSRIVLRVGNGDNIDIDDSIDRDPTNEGILESCWHTTRPWDREVRRYGTFERYGIHHALLGVRRLISSRPVIKCGYPFLAFINPARTFSRRNATESMRMRDKVVVSQDGAEKIEGYFRQVIFDSLFFNWSIFLIWLWMKFGTNF